MKKLLILLMIVTSFSCCKEKQQVRGKTQTTVQPTQQFENYSLVEVDGEICTIWDYFKDTDSYRLIPIHRETENGFRVKSKYLKQYTPK